MVGIEKDKKQIFCKICGNDLGEITDGGQIFRIRKTEIFSRQKFWCTCGGFSFTFIPLVPADNQTAEQKANTRSVLLELGSEKKNRQEVK